MRVTSNRGFTLDTHLPPMYETRYVMRGPLLSRYQLHHLSRGSLVDGCFNILAPGFAC
jgi:hypothetical protein